MDSMIGKWNWILGMVDDDMGISHTWRNFKVVNTDEYDIKPKKDYLKRRVAEKEDELRRLEGMKESMLRSYDSRIMEIKTDIERLKKET
jgi:hypothetical protein